MLSIISPSQEAHFIIKLILGSILIMLAILSAALCEFVPLRLNIEIAITASVSFIVLACLQAFYQDIKSYHETEAKLAEAILDQLQQIPGEHPSRAVAWSILKDQLEKESNYTVRLETLYQYQNNEAARAKLVAATLEEEAEIAVLEALGLR